MSEQIPAGDAGLYTEKEVTVEDALEHGLTEEEFELIKGHLGGRVPTVTELGIYSGLWSEHASYKNSILQLKTLPTESSRVLSKAGEENAGALDIGDGLAVVFKIESHNHPTAVEPYQGAATGVGGIMRDIFTMGARPICSLNSLRFGPPDNSRSKYLLSRAVKGIGDYGNCLGIAVSGGELFFDESFARNVLVNAMTVGVVKHGKMASATASGEGNPVFIVGATTGRDGIHGASFASRDLSEESESKRSAVQVGDPFMEKLLLEATLELIDSGALIGIQDMGAAGLSCASSEMSAKGGAGMELNLDLVPLREEGMSAYEIMLSESQERMLVVAKPGRESDVISIFEKWDLHAVEIGRVTSDGMLKISRNGKLCTNIPAESLVLGGGAPRYKREIRRPAYLDEKAAIDADTVPDTTDVSADLLSFIGSNNICSRRPLFEQYDTEVGLVKSIGPGGDGGVARIPGTERAVAVSTDCNSRYVYLNPRRGASQAVFESARNVAVTGAVPIGITNNLNFANPYIPENYYFFAESIAGMREACLSLEIPVTGGNVSFYNESQDGPIYPTPTIGMVGLLDNVNHRILPFFQNPGDEIYLAGHFRPVFGGSEYLSWKHKSVHGEIPSLNFDEEKALVRLLTEGAEKKIHSSAHDLSLGGLSVALFKSAYNSFSGKTLGFELEQDAIQALRDQSETQRLDRFWFGETNGCAILSVSPENRVKLVELAERLNVPLISLGVVNDRSIFDYGSFKLDSQAAVREYEKGLVSVFEV